MDQLPPPPRLALPDAEPVVALRGLTKRFGKITANDAITLEIRPGASRPCWARTARARARS